MRMIQRSLLILIAGTLWLLPVSFSESIDANAVWSAISNVSDNAPLPKAAVYVALRGNGEKLAFAWGSMADSRVSFETALNAAEKLLTSSAERTPVDTIEVCFAHNFRRVGLTESEGFPRNDDRGVLGLELQLGNRVLRIAPTEMIAQNASFERVMKEFVASFSAEAQQSPVTAGVFEADQVLVYLESPPRAVRMRRGATYVPPTAVTRDAAQKLVDGMAAWLARQVHENGRMTYQYEPTLARETDANNELRQFMASVALGRAAKWKQTQELRALSDRNIAYNLKRFYKNDPKDDVGYIDFNGQAKLGAAACAALLLLEHPAPTAEWTTARDMLIKLTHHQWNEDGSFRTFYWPPDKNDNQNFYPGETLYLWSSLYASSPDPMLRDKFMKSFAYYRDWHRKNHNPAFVPWHTQAYCAMLKQFDDAELKSFVLEMNDWLVTIQQWETAPYEDQRGRFYSPEHPDYGPPHASSTGVYIEGLVDAFALARKLGDTARAERYRLAIVRGLRSLLQLQFTGGPDCYYVLDRGPVTGGIRVNEYDNRIRVDNVQHGLMGVLKVLQIFGDADWATD